MLEGLMSMNQQQLMEESLSNLTSEASNSSINPSSLHQQQNPSSNKKKRSLPGNPDPDAEVIALSPKSLLAKNRFLCEICNKGFQRDQNLQLHRRGHNLPWKLKQRSKTEVVRKKVYVCPETSCVHHDPSRALGDLTGIKKHFCRKHGEKKWKCDKCSKKYAVQSDWKAHSKICGTREYKCDCGTLFSRRDSFITHRAFCDVLAEEAARTTASNPLLLPPPPQLQQLHPHHHPPHQSGSQIYSLDQNPEIFSIKQEIQNSSFNLIPPWMMHQSSQQIQNPSNVLGGVDGGGGGPTGYFPTVSGSHLSSSLLSPQAPQMSATALLQKAAQIGATISTKIAEAAEQDDDPLQFPSATSSSHRTPPDHVHSTTAGFGLNLSSHDHQQQEQEDMNSNINGFFNNGGFRIGFSSSSSSSLLNDVMMNSLSNAFSVDNNTPFGNTNNNNDGLTKDFLGLRPLSTSDILSFAGFSNSINNAAPSSSSATHHQQDLQNKSWQG